MFICLMINNLTVSNLAEYFVSSYMAKKKNLTNEGKSSFQSQFTKFPDMFLRYFYVTQTPKCNFYTLTAMNN